MRKPVRITGRYEETAAGGEKVRAFVPNPLPPQRPRLKLDGQIAETLGRAEQHLARLAIADEMVPSVDWFLYGFIRKEAVISSQIEGVQATLDDLLTAEGSAGSEVADSDVEEVCNYVDAFKFARHEIGRDRGLPLSIRLLNETHRRLLRGARGAGKAPGEIRRTQNWIGGTRPGNAAFVPPPPHLLAGLLRDLERYFHADNGLPPLIRLALVHVQFETIHPYLDGNGRLGRLLIALLLEQWRLLPTPLLYLSLHFKRHRSEYYRLLDRVRTEGDWEAWVVFFLEGVAAIAEEAKTTAYRLFRQISHDRARLLNASAVSVTSIKVFEKLPQHPILSIARVTELLSTTKPTAMKAVHVLADVGILAETTGRKRDRLFRYSAYLDHLRAGTDL